MAEPKKDGSTKRSGKASLGRRIATVIYWIFAIYIVSVGIYSIVPQVFWPRTRATPAAVTCAAGVVDLRGELLARAGDRVAAGGSRDAAGLTAWLADWDARHAGLEARCTGDQHAAWVLLGRLRQRVESSLVRFDDEEGSLARDMDETLAELGEHR